MTIRLNGEPFEIAAPVTISALLAQLDIDARRVAVEHNLIVVKRERYDLAIVGEGDEVEIVNFVGGGHVLRATWSRATCYVIRAACLVMFSS